MTVVPESGSRIDAAARAICDAWVAAAHPALRTPGRCEEWREEATKLAPLAIAAADEAETPIAEKLAAALRHLVDVIDGPPFTDASEIEADIVMSEARDALAEFRVSAPVENPK